MGNQNPELHIYVELVGDYPGRLSTNYWKRQVWIFGKSENKRGKNLST